MSESDVFETKDLCECKKPLTRKKANCQEICENCNKKLFYDKTDLDCLRRRSEPHYERIPGDIIRPSSLSEVLGQIYDYTDQLHGPSASSSNIIISGEITLI